VLQQGSPLTAAVVHTWRHADKRVRVRESHLRLAALNSPYLKERMGTLQLFWCSAAAIPVACFLLPFMSDLLPYVPSWFLYICVELYLGLKVMSFATGFTCVTVLINNSGPSLSRLSRVNSAYALSPQLSICSVHMLCRCRALTRSPNS
jgi:hypothetical protein